MLNLEKTPTF